MPQPGGGTISLKEKPSPTSVVFEAMTEKNTYAYPNPSSGEVTLRFSLKRPEKVKIQIEDISGYMVWQKVISENESKRGINYILCNGKNDTGGEILTGLYLFKISASEKVIEKRL